MTYQYSFGYKQYKTWFQHISLFLSRRSEVAASLVSIAGLCQGQLLQALLDLFLRSLTYNGYKMTTVPDFTSSLKPEGDLSSLSCCLCEEQQNCCFVLIRTVSNGHFKSMFPTGKDTLLPRSKLALCFEENVGTMFWSHFVADSRFVAYQ